MSNKLNVIAYRIKKILKTIKSFKDLASCNFY